MTDTPRPYRLRPATPADAPALAALGTRAFTAKFGQMYRPQDLAAFLAEAYSEAAIAAELADPAKLFHVAESRPSEDQGTPSPASAPLLAPLLAWCKLGLTCGFPQHARGRRVMELKQLYTAPEATGTGLGTALMDWAMAEFTTRGADEVQLSVWSGNAQAQRFYARYGFAKVADVTFRVGEQLDEEFLFARMV